MSEDEYLDMRYDANNTNLCTAADILNQASEFELVEMFQKFSDERYAQYLARTILEERAGIRGPILRTGQLKQLVRKAFNQTQVPGADGN